MSLQSKKGITTVRSHSSQSSSFQKIINRDWILSYFHAFKKKKENLFLGVEAELLGVDSQTGHAIPYEGNNGIKGVFSGLANYFFWEPVLESENPIALKRGNIEVHLEPGGQLEFSCAPHSSLYENLKELQQLYKELKKASEDRSISWLELGIQPFSDLEEISWVPKNRYKIMSCYLAKRGALAHRMMKQTATLQANMDYTDERDMMEKLRTAMALAPVMVGLFANSSIMCGKVQKKLSMRAQIWTETDPDRCGIMRSVLVDKPDLESYIDTLLQIPMIFIVRNGEWIDVHGMTFKTFLHNGYEGLYPIVDDWELFISTIFTEARLNPFVEIRSLDRNSLSLSIGILALWKGLLLSSNARESVWQMIGNWTFEERMQYFHQASEFGSGAVFGKYRIGELGARLIEIAHQGLKELFHLGFSTEDESVYLESVKQLVLEERVCPAEKILKYWEGSWNRDPQKLIHYCRI